MKTKHTSGPWKLRKSKYHEHTIQNESGQMQVAEINIFDTDEASLANGKLIATAPELLYDGEFLRKEVMNILSRGKNYTPSWQEFDRLQAAAKTFEMTYKKATE